MTPPERPDSPPEMSDELIEVLLDIEERIAAEDAAAAQTG